MFLSLEAYVDESGSHDASPVLCLACYAADAMQVAHFDREWQEVLDLYKLPFFHMVECAHGTGHFAALSKRDRIEVQTRMIGIIKRRMEHGFAVTMNENEYDLRIGAHGRKLYGDPYCKCLRICMESVTHWGDKYQMEGEVAFVFETGHRSQPAADAMMNGIFKVPELRQRHRYRTHSFADKQSVLGLQAADLLAWQWATDYKRQMQNQPRRLDLNSLLELPHKVMHFTPAILQDYSDFANMVMQTDNE